MLAIHRLSADDQWFWSVPVQWHQYHRQGSEWKRPPAYSLSQFGSAAGVDQKSTRGSQSLTGLARSIRQHIYDDILSTCADILSESNLTALCQQTIAGEYMKWQLVMSDQLQKISNIQQEENWSKDWPWEIIIMIMISHVSSAVTAVMTIRWVARQTSTSVVKRNWRCEKAYGRTT